MGKVLVEDFDSLQRRARELEAENALLRAQLEQVRDPDEQAEAMRAQVVLAGYELDDVSRKLQVIAGRLRRVAL